VESTESVHVGVSIASPRRHVGHQRERARTRERLRGHARPVDVSKKAADVAKHAEVLRERFGRGAKSLRVVARVEKWTNRREGDDEGEEDGGEDDRTGWEGARVGARMRARVGAAAPTALDVHARAEVWMGGIRASVANAR